MAAPNPSFLRALPPYIGSKRRLVALMFAELDGVLPRSAWPACALADPFCGSGAVSLYAKVLGFSVAASDIAERACTVARALVQNSSVKTSVPDVISIISRTPMNSERLELLQEVLQPQVAQLAACVLDVADEHPDPKRSLLRLLAIKLILRSVPISLPRARDSARAATGDFDGITARRVSQYLTSLDIVQPARLLSLAQDINAGVFPGSGIARQGDALSVLAGMDGDVVYLDPPYGRTSSYGREYLRLDRILGDSVTLVPRVKLDDVLDAAGRFNIVVLSYGGPDITTEALTQIVARHRRVVRALGIRYPHLRPLSSEVKRVTNEEQLVIAAK